MKKVQVENEKVEINVDFKMVWEFMWRAYVILFGIGFAIGILVSMFS